MLLANIICARLAPAPQWLCGKFQETRKLIYRGYTLRRALLYSPGDDIKKLTKSLTYDVDCIVMDCEDGVAASRKSNAREVIRSFLDEREVTKKNPEWSVRINSVQSEFCEEDISAILSAKSLPPTILLPKVDDGDHLQWFSEKIWQKLMERPEEDRGPLNLIMLIESAKAIMTLPDICKKAEDLATMAPFVPVGLVLGSDDLLADLGASRTETGSELIYARQKFVLVAKAFHLQAIDMVNINYKDLRAFKKECTQSYLMGFTGKQVIHPHQVPLAQECYVPSTEQIEWAKRIIERFDHAQKYGKGVFSHRDSMIDMPTVRQAQNVLEAARGAGIELPSTENSPES